MIENRTRRKLERGQPVVGSLTLLNEPAIAEILGAHGYDFLVTDTEHAPMDGQGLLGMVRGSEAGGVTPMVRARRVDEKDFLWMLDIGVQGILIPMLDDAPTARKAAEIAYFPPVGRRTLCSATRAAAHGSYRQNFQGYLDHSNANTVLVGLLETPTALANLDDILEEAIDVFMVGRADLSLAMGLGYDPGHPDVVRCAEEALKRVIAAGKTAGILAYTAHEAMRWLDFGCKFIVYNQPEMVLSNHYAYAMTSLRTHAEIGGMNDVKSQPSDRLGSEDQSPSSPPGPR